MVFSCGLSEDSEEFKQVNCPLIQLVDTAEIDFNSSAIQGKKFRLYDGADLVADTCTMFYYSTAQRSYRFVEMNPNLIRMSISFYQAALPVSSGFSLYAAPDCASAFVPVGIASLNYSFQNEKTGPTECAADTKVARHTVSFL